MTFELKRTVTVEHDIIVGVYDGWTHVRIEGTHYPGNAIFKRNEVKVQYDDGVVVIYEVSGVSDEPIMNEFGYPSIELDRSNPSAFAYLSNCTFIKRIVENREKDIPEF